ncbi:MAG TPA: hypothetical protein VI756_21685 [Blastocatellia bacterium]
MRLTSSSNARPRVAAATPLPELDSVSEESLRFTVETLCTPRHYFAERSANQYASGWIAEQFRSLGYTTQSQGRSPTFWHFLLAYKKTD